MVEMHNWGTFLKEKRVTLAGMKGKFPSQANWSVMEEPNKDDEVKWSKAVHGLTQGGRSKRYTRVPIASTMQRLQDYHRMHQMWRRQQEALQRRMASPNAADRTIEIAGQKKAVKDLMWKPGKPYQIHSTDGKSYALPGLGSSLRPGFLSTTPFRGREGIQEDAPGRSRAGFIGVGGPSGFHGSVVTWLNRLIGMIPGLRDPTDIIEQRRKVKDGDRALRAMNLFYRQRSKNPNWQMSDGDKKLVSNMMHNYYTETMGDKLEPAAIRMLANGIPKFDKDHMDALHQSMTDYVGDLSWRNVGGHAPVNLQEVQQLVAEATVKSNAIKRARRKSKKGNFDDEDMPALDFHVAPERDHPLKINYDITPDQFKEMWGGLQPTSSPSLDDPASTIRGWDKHTPALMHILAGLQRSKLGLHGGQDKHSSHLHSLDVQGKSLDEFFFSPDSQMQKHLDGVQAEKPREALQARHVLQHVMRGWDNGNERHHNLVNNMVGYVLGSEGYLKAGIEAAPEAFPHYVEGKPASVFRDPMPEVNTEYREDTQAPAPEGELDMLGG
jgi:hypothetical protein